KRFQRDGRRGMRKRTQQRLGIRTEIAFNAGTDRMPRGEDQEFIVVAGVLDVRDASDVSSNAEHTFEVGNLLVVRILVSHGTIFSFGQWKTCRDGVCILQDLRMKRG